MRVLLIIITLLGGAILGCSLAGRAHYLASRSDFLAVLYPKEGSRVPKEQLEVLQTQLEAQELSQQKDWLTVRYLGGTAFLLSFSALILERRRYVARNAA